jgi:DNA-binding MarR family transcriptional regulator
MMKRGWITIRGQEGRKQELALTKKGEDLIKKALPAWRKAQARAQAVLGKKEFLALTKITEGLWTKNQKSSYQKK